MGTDFGKREFLLVVVRDETILLFLPVIPFNLPPSRLHLLCFVRDRKGCASSPRVVSFRAPYVQSDDTDHRFGLDGDSTQRFPS